VDEELRNYLVSLEERMNQRMAQMEEQAEQRMAQMEERMERSLAALTTLAARPSEVPEYLISAEAAAYIQVHVKTLLEWVRLGVFPHVPLPGAGKDNRYSRTMIDEWAKARALGKTWNKGPIKDLF
jgi:hypothetical protein